MIAAACDPGNTPCRGCFQPWQSQKKSLDLAVILARQTWHSLSFSAQGPHAMWPHIFRLLLLPDMNAVFGNRSMQIPHSGVAAAASCRGRLLAEAAPLSDRRLIEVASLAASSFSART